MENWRVARLTPDSQDITTCQQKGKTILLSIGGATYSEGGFKSEADAQAGAKLIWETFGPVQNGSNALRPFGNAILDGFDFDFEATVTYMAPFANGLRALMDKETSKKFFLTAAPQCPYPDQADKDILNGPVSIDAVWVQFYNNYCGVNNFNTDSTVSKFNFEEWDVWAKTVSQNKNVKVMVGVPADTTAASTGYIPADKLNEVIAYSKKFESFGGVMMWDATQAYANQGFLDDVRKALGSGDSGSSSSSTSASTTASAPSSTNSPNTLQSTNTPDSSSSSSSSSGSGSSSSGPENPEATDSATSTAAPTAAPNAESTTTKSTTKPIAKPIGTLTTKPSPTSTAEPLPTNSDDNSDDDGYFDDFDGPDTNGPSENSGASNINAPQQNSNQGVQKLISSDLFDLLKGIRSANDAAAGLTHGLVKNLRRVNRIGH